MARSRHYVWVAFLHRNHDEARERARLDGTCWDRLTNRAICWLDWSTIFHVQLMFYNAMHSEFVTFSIDAEANRVWARTRKLFRRGWTFVRLEISAAQECAMYEFLGDHVRRHTPYDALGAYASIVRPIDNHHTSFFCSQLAAAALQAGGLLRNMRDYAITPAALYSLIHTLPNASESTNPVLL